MKSQTSLSISGHKKSYVISQLSKAFNDRNYELACYYSVQMHVSNWLSDWWHIVVCFAAKNINVNNPKIGKFLYCIVSEYPDISGNTSRKKEIRETIALISGVLTFSPKDVIFPMPKAMESTESRSLINCLNFYPIQYIVERESQSNDSILILKIMSKIVQSIEDGNCQESFRLIGLCLYLEKEKEFKEKIKCGYRNWEGISEKQRSDWVFLFWDIIVHISTKNTELYNIIISWRNLYVKSYITQKRNSLWSYFVNCIILLTHPLKIDIKCVQNEDVINKGCGNIDILYKQITLKN